MNRPSRTADSPMSRDGEQVARFLLSGEEARSLCDTSLLAHLAERDVEVARDLVHLTTIGRHPARAAHTSSTIGRARRARRADHRRRRRRRRRTQDAGRRNRRRRQTTRRGTRAPRSPSPRNAGRARVCRVVRFASLCWTSLTLQTRPPHPAAAAVVTAAADPRAGEWRGTEREE